MLAAATRDRRTWSKAGKIKLFLGVTLIPVFRSLPLLVSRPRPPSKYDNVAAETKFTDWQSNLNEKQQFYIHVKSTLQTHFSGPKLTLAARK